MKPFYVGTSGWIYKGWAGSFYPEKLSAPAKFQFYASHFPTVEINNTFYRLPTLKAVEGWAKQAPPGFIYAVKGSRFITQMKKLNVEWPSIEIFFERIAPLKKRIGPILWQLPPNFGKNTERLERFLGMLPKEYRYAVEFRNPSWVTDDVFEILRKHKAAHATVSSLRMPMDFTVTAGFTYIRFHGLEGGAAHHYTEEEMAPWAKFCRRCLKRGLAVYVYFNNDINTRAPENAHTFEKMVLGRKTFGALDKKRQFRSFQPP